MDIQLLKQIFNKPTLKSINEEIPPWAYIVAGIIGAVMILIPPFTGGRDGLEIQAYAVFCMFVFLLIVCVFIKNKSLRLRIFILDIAFFSGYHLQFAGAVNDFPKFIRSIQGEYFVIMWLIYSVGIYFVAFCIQAMCNASISNRGLTKLQKETYSDNDIMLISGYSRYKYICYYILKAKTDGLINFTYLKNQEGLLIHLNGYAAYITHDSYYKENPQIKQLVEFLRERIDFGKTQTTVEDVIMNFEPDVDICSSGGKVLAKRIFRADNFKNVIICIAFCLVYYVGITKLMMGMYNDKELFNLVIYGFPISYIMLWIFVKLVQDSFYQKAKENIWEQILDVNKSNMPDFVSILQNVLADKGEVNEYQINQLLRYYATNYETTRWSWLNTPEQENKYAYAFLNYVAAAEKRDADEAADKIRISNSGGYYGCSSCSSCSGCGGGGGGGGCGGCGN